jgi:hypothetical protein
MTPPPPSLGSVITQYFPLVAGIVGTIAVSLGGLAKFKEKRQADLMDATTTWRQLAEARHAALEEERERAKTIIRLLTESREREQSLWVYIRQLQGAAVAKPLPPPPILPAATASEMPIPIPPLPPHIEDLL